MLLNHYGNYEISVSALREDEETEKSSILEYDLKVPKGLATRYNSAGTEVIFGVYESSLVKGKVIIPEEVNGKPVTTLLNNAFKDCDKMTGIVLPDTIKTIGMMAFMNCANMTRCKLPEFLETIEAGLFKNCISLLKIEQFNYVKTIYSDAFQGCASLKELIIPSTFTWGRGSHPLSLENCDNFEYIEFPSNYQGELPRFGDKLPKIELNGNKNIIYDDLNNCYVSGDKSTLLLGDYNSTIPSYISTIGEYAFYKRSIKNIEIPSNVKVIELYAFAGCNNLEGLILNEGIEELGLYAFNGCESLKSIYIPSTLTKIHSSTTFICDSFYNVDFLKIEVSDENPIYISDGNCLIEKETLSIVKGNSNSIIPNYIKTIKPSAFFSCKFLDIKLPDSLERIESNAFLACTNLKEVRIPKTVKYIGRGAFYTGSIQLNIYLPKEVEYVDDHIGPTVAEAFQVTTIFIDTEETPKEWHHDWYYICHIVKTEFSYDGDIPYVESILVSIYIGSVNVPYREGYECIGFSFKENSDEIDYEPKIVIGRESGNPLLVIFTDEEFIEIIKTHKGERLYVIWKKI